MPPDFTAVKFFASLMNTSSIPPERIGGSFFPLLKVFFPAQVIKMKEREKARQGEREREREREKRKKRRRRRETDNEIYIKIYKNIY